MKIILMIGAILMLLSSIAMAQGKLGPCGKDLRRLCPDIQPGNNRLDDCMREHIHDVSDRCLVELAKFTEVRGSRKDCNAYLQQQCGQVERRGGQFEACLKSAVGGLSDTCKNALARAVSRAR